MRKLATGVIFHRDRYLLLKRSHNWKGWEFVKGNLEKKENFKKALLREIREEAGLKKIRIISELPEEIIYKHESINGHTTSMQKGFLVEYLSGKVKLSFEHSGYRWVNAKEAKKLLTHQSHRTFLALAEKERKIYRKEIIERLSKKHATSVKFDGKFISIHYDGQKLRCRAVKRAVRDVGIWSKKENTVYYDKNLTDKTFLAILVHEVVEKYTAQTYGLDTDTEAHLVATAVEKEFVVDPKWISQQRSVANAWVATNRQKIGKSKFY
jgi:8-oxo-dGTP diphosphatase